MTDRYAVIGNPIGHSKSPLIHASFAAATSQDMQYTTLEGPLTGCAGTVRAFFEGGGLGLNVTVPFKLEAFELADERSERARLAGAANALKWEAGRIWAENFDGIGLVHDIQVNLAYPLAGKRVLMLGAGGATRGALLPLLEQGPNEIVVANRDLGKAQVLVASLATGHPVRASSYAALGESGFDLVINATSASLYRELPPVSSGVFKSDGLAYDMVYGKGLTPFLSLAKGAGAKQIADGVGMLVEQAAEAFVWWRGVRPDTRSVIDRLTIPLV